MKSVTLITMRLMKRFPKHECKEREIWDAQTLFKAIECCNDPRLKLCLIRSPEIRQRHRPSGGSAPRPPRFIACSSGAPPPVFAPCSCAQRKRAIPYGIAPSEASRRSGRSSALPYPPIAGICSLTCLVSVFQGVKFDCP